MPSDVHNSINYSPVKQEERRKELAKQVGTEAECKK